MLQIAPFHLPNYKSFLFMGKGHTRHSPFPYPSPTPEETSVIVPTLVFFSKRPLVAIKLFLFYFILSDSNIIERPMSNKIPVVCRLIIEESCKTESLLVNTIQ